jgi:thioredoxin-like negative regulator of GroEL
LYNKAHNEYLNLAATTGTLGLLGYFGLIATYTVWGVKIIFNSRERKPPFYLTVALLAGYLSILISNFFGFSVVVVALFFFLIPALDQLARESGKSPKWKPVNRTGPGQNLKVFFVLAGLGYVTFLLGKIWYADYRFAEGDKLAQAGYHQEATTPLTQSISLRPAEPLYHNSLALTAASLAKTAYLQEQADTAGQLAELAIDQSDRVIGANPYHLNYWKNRVRVFYTLTEIDEKYYQEVLTSLLQTAALAPTDAKIFYNLGLVYIQLQQTQEAIGTLEKAVQLKPNYADARFALALLYEQTGKNQAAANQLRYILEKINPDDGPAREKFATPAGS